MNDSSPQPVVVHYVSTFLPSSQSWIYHQMRFLKRFRPVVVTKRTQNLNLFPPVAELYVLHEQPWYRVLLEKLAYKRQGWFPLCAQTARRHGARVFHSHGGDYGVREHTIKRKLDIAHVVSFYGADIWKHAHLPEWQCRYREMFQASDLFLAEGNVMRNKVLEIGCPPEKIKVHHLGVDLEHIPFLPRRPDPDGTVRVLVAGRSVDKKGHVLAFETFARVAQRRPNLKLLALVGGEFPECQRNLERMRAIIRDHHLEDRVEWKGLTSFDKYLEAIRQAHIFLAPSMQAEDGDAEGGAPVTLIELSAGGMPVVSTTHCDIPEVILDGRTGLLAPEKDLDALADRLDHLVTHPESWEAFGAAGRRHVEQEYNARRQCERLEELYDAAG